jgi:hypothetical protein
MANPIFYGCDVSFLTYSMSQTENGAFPLSNLQALMPDRYLWKSSNSTNGQQLVAYATTISGGSANRNFVVVDGHNFSSIVSAGGRVQIQYAADSGFTVALTTVFDTSTDGVGNPQVISFVSTTRTYVRILFTTLGGVVPQVGNFWVGTYLDFGAPYNNPFTPGNRQFKSSEGEALDGRMRTSQAFAGRKYWKMDFSNMSDAVRSAFAVHFNTTRGKLYPFYFQDTDGTIYYVKFDIDLDPSQVQRFNVNDIKQITFKTQLLV